MKIINEGDGLFKFEGAVINHRHLVSLRVDEVKYDPRRKLPYPARMTGVFELRDDLISSEYKFLYVPNSVAFPEEPEGINQYGRDYLAAAILEAVSRCEVQPKSTFIPEFPKFIRSFIDISIGVFIGAMIARGC